jgi:fused signal recognition particle receptor
MESLEEILYTSDMGPETVQVLMTAVTDEMQAKGSAGLPEVVNTLRLKIHDIFAESGTVDRGPRSLSRAAEGPSVVLVLGVNGAGKTTTIGKLARKLAEEGHKVLVAAGDTFRAAAGAQLAEWSRRAQVEILQLEGVTDPSAVAYQAVEKAIAQQFDFVLIDTAGRLHTQKNLMEELRKIQRTITKRLGREADEALIVLDANSGQNALIQAKEFHSAVPVTGVVLTKMDGTAKGGVAIGVARELRVPIRFVGVGEKAEDLRAFDVDEFIDQILPASSSP